MAAQTELEAELVENRRFPRTSVIWPGVLEGNGEKLSCIAINLSANGAMLRLSYPLNNDAKSWILTIPNLGKFQVEVAWRASDGGRDIGLKFHNPPVMVAQQLAHILSKPEDSFFTVR